MVITGCFSYMKRHGLSRKVSIKDMAEDLCKNGSETVRLIVDFSRFQYLPYICKDCQFGWEWDIVIKRLKNFVENLRKINVEPIFYFREETESFNKEKWKYWIQKDDDKIQNIFDSLREDGYSSENCFPQDQVYFRFILKYECHAEVYSVIGDIYSQLAEYATKQENCLGILSAHANYLIFDTKPLLLLRNLDFSSLSTYMCVPSQFIKKINLTASQLKLFSFLAGNDIINFKKLEFFHKRLGYEHWKYGKLSIIDKIANYIKERKWNGNIEELPIIARITGIDEELLRKEFVSYDKLIESDRFDDSSIDFSNKVNLLKEKLIHCEVPPRIYELLRDQIYVESRHFQDIRDISIPSFTLIYREMRQKMYRILFHNQHANITEWYFYNGSNLDKPDIVSIDEDEFNDYIPSMEEFFSENKNIEGICWELFSYCVETEIDLLIELVNRNTNPALVGLFCILNYLLKHRIRLKQWELKVFFCQALHPNRNDNEYIRELKVNYSPRILQLDDLFQRGIYNLMHVLTVCGFPFSLENVMPWKLFNRKLFVYLYNKMEDSPSIEEALRYDINSVTSCNKLYEMLPFDLAEA